MASNLLKLIAFAAAALLAVACASIDENDILGALAASPPPSDDDRDGGRPCVPACTDGLTCVTGQCIDVGADDDCDPACDPDGCQVCRVDFGDLALCVSLCDPALCEQCDGEGSCESWCGDDEICVQGTCFASSGGACANSSDLALFGAGLEYNALGHAFECMDNECDDNVSCIGSCMAAGRWEPLGIGPTRDCGRCFAEEAVCVVDDCGEACLNDPTGANCALCFETTCIPLFCECAGHELDTRCDAVR